MLIRVVCAVKDKKLYNDFGKRLSLSDVQLKMCGHRKVPWNPGGSFILLTGLTGVEE